MLSLYLISEYCCPLPSPPQIMSCCGHIRIVDGLVYFRYGGFFVHWYRLLRFVQAVKAIKVGRHLPVGLDSI